jgi:hypothetical protein
MATGSTAKKIGIVVFCLMAIAIQIIKSGTKSMLRR